MRRLDIEKCEAALSGITPLMSRLTRSPDATYFYDMLSGAIFWSDEFPDFRALRAVPDWHVIRYVLRYRTTLILEAPDEKMRYCWDRGQQLFFAWPGFDPDRRSPSLRPIVEELETRANESIQALGD